MGEGLPHSLPVPSVRGCSPVPGTPKLQSQKWILVLTPPLTEHLCKHSLMGAPAAPSLRGQEPGLGLRVYPTFHGVLPEGAGQERALEALTQSAPSLGLPEIGDR